MSPSTLPWGPSSLQILTTCRVLVAVTLLMTSQLCLASKPESGQKDLAQPQPASNPCQPFTQGGPAVNGKQQQQQQPTQEKQLPPGKQEQPQKKKQASQQKQRQKPQQKQNQESQQAKHPPQQPKQQQPQPAKRQPQQEKKAEKGKKNPKAQDQGRKALEVTSHEATSLQGASAGRPSATTQALPSGSKPKSSGGVQSTGSGSKPSVGTESTGQGSKPSANAQSTGSGNKPSAGTPIGSTSTTAARLRGPKDAAAVPPPCVAQGGTTDVKGAQENVQGGQGGHLTESQAAAQEAFRKIPQAGTPAPAAPQAVAAGALPLSSSKVAVGAPAAGMGKAPASAVLSGGPGANPAPKGSISPELDAENKHQTSATRPGPGTGGLPRNQIVSDPKAEAAKGRKGDKSDKSDKGGKSGKGGKSDKSDKRDKGHKGNKGGRGNGTSGTHASSEGGGTNGTPPDLSSHDAREAWAWDHSGGSTSAGATWQPPTLAEVIQPGKGGKGSEELAATGTPREPYPFPPMGYSWRSRAFREAFEFQWWCNNTWLCNQNPDGSVTLNTYWNDRCSVFKSRNDYLHGVFSVEMRLPRGSSQGLYHTFYLIQRGDIPNNDSRHAEIDIEFYGNKDANSTLIATNIITNGYERLEQHLLPFDPSKEFHRYTILWSSSKIVFFVDEHPIRVTKRTPRGPWPAKPLQLFGSTWDNSGNVDYSDGPVSVHYRRVEYGACTTKANSPSLPLCVRAGDSPMYLWNAKLSQKQTSALEEYRRKYMVNAWDWGKWKGYAKHLFNRKGNY